MEREREAQRLERSREEARMEEERLSKEREEKRVERERAEEWARKVALLTCVSPVQTCLDTCVFSLRTYKAECSDTHALHTRRGSFRNYGRRQRGISMR